MSAFDLFLRLLLLVLVVAATGDLDWLLVTAGAAGAAATTAILRSGIADLDDQAGS